MSKAQGLSLKTIIIAIVALIVLVVLWAIFTGKIGSFGEGLDEKEIASSDYQAQLRVDMGLQDGICGKGKTFDCGTKSADCVAIGCGALSGGKCTGGIKPCSSIGDKASCTKAGCTWP